MGAYLSNDQNEHQKDNEQRCPEDPARLDDAVTSDTDGRSEASVSEHRNQVFSNGHILAQTNGPEDAHHVMANGCIAIGGDIAEEVNHVVIGVVCNVNSAEEHDYVAINSPLCVDVAEEADSVVNRLIGGDVNAASELDDIAAGVGARRAGDHSYSEQ